MRLMKRNLRTIYYSLYSDRLPILDDEGYETGETGIGYEDPVELKCNVSPASGRTTSEMFGSDENYDKIIITDQMDCPINENTMLFVDRMPEWSEDEPPVLLNTADYMVKRVARPLNHIIYAVSRVKGGAS